MAATNVAVVSTTNGTVGKKSIVGDKVTVELMKSTKLSEPAVEAYEKLSTVPHEFLVTDPKKIPNRLWGDDDESRAQDFPLIDLSSLFRLSLGKPQRGDEEVARKVIQEMGDASQDWGFFQVVNHGIPESLLDRVLEVANEFFQLPMEEKEAYAVRPGETEGYGRLDYNLSGPGGPRTRFWNDVMRHDIRPVPEVKKDRMPNKPVSYRPVMEEYTQGMERVLQIVWESLSLYLGLDKDTLQRGQNDVDEAHLIIRLNYYPTCAEPEKVLGVGAHKDFGSMTVLLQDEVGGLQVQKPNTTGFLDVKPIKGSLLINIANQVEILSNGRLHSVVHRALVNRSSSRVSVAAFATPGPKCVIAPLKQVLDLSQKPARYTSLVYGEYAKNFAADVKKGVSPHVRYEINRN